MIFGFDWFSEGIYISSDNQLKSYKMKKIKIFELETHVWIAGFANIAGLISQIYTLISTQTSEGLSLVMCVMFNYIQFVYARLGKKTGNKALMWCMYISFIIELFIIIYTLYLRN